MKYELYHAVKKGSIKADHKYVRREWKHGRWVYYYEDDTADEKPIGQNYKTVEQREQERIAAENEKIEAEAKIKAKEKRIEKVATTIEEIIDKGKKAVDKVTHILNSRIVDLPKAIEYAIRDEEDGR